MSWEKEPLLAKAKLFFERALDEEREDPVFALWCTLGLELLARTALASISPTLLAESDRDHRYLLHALGRGSERVQRRSISAVQVFTLCKTLVAGIGDEDVKLCLALMNCRNEELHTGAAAFEQFPATKWLAGFYAVCTKLCGSLGVELAELLGEEEAKIAEGMITQNREDARQRVEASIAAHRRVFEGKSTEEKDQAAQQAEERGEELATKRHHRVNCPACACVATVQGTPFGKEQVANEDDMIVVRRAVSPDCFECQACGLKLGGYTDLEVANLGGHYTRKTTYEPADYFGLIHPDDIDDYIDDEDRRYPEFDNE